MNEKLKQHFKKHKNLYIGVGIGVVVGVTLAGFTHHIMKEKEFRAVLLKGADAQDAATTDSFSLFNNAVFGDNANVVSTIHTGSKGHPGFITECLETGDKFETQGAASRYFNIPPNVMSMHLNGKIDDANGLHFVRSDVLV